MKSPRIYEKMLISATKILCKFMQDFFQKIAYYLCAFFLDETKKVTMKNFC